MYVEEADSTNTLLAKESPNLDHGTAIAARRQTAGKGQRGNSWESEPGKNLTFSLLLRPKAILASHQFELLQSVVISIVKVLRSQLGTEEVYIKWPNDVYYRDRKICGILIENTLSGAGIECSIAGIGINVNQDEFISDAPNPVSMKQISGHDFDLDHLLELFVTQIVSDFDKYEKTLNSTQLAARYRFMMWRGEGYWPYIDTATGTRFEARIAAVAPTGHLTLALTDGRVRTYAFKEVAAVL